MYTMLAEVNGKPAKIITRHIDSPAVVDGILAIDNLRIECPTTYSNGVIDVKLRLEPA